MRPAGVLFFFLVILRLYSQEPSKDHEYRVGDSLESVLRQIDKLEGVYLHYKSDWFEDEYLEKNISTNSLNTALYQLLSPLDMNFYVFNGQYIIDPGLTNQKDSVEINENVDVVIGVSDSNDKATIHGRIINQFEEKLAGATVIVGDEGVSSSIDGEYSITIVPGVYTLTAKYIGLQDLTMRIYVRGDGILDLELFESLTELDEVVVSSQIDDSNIVDLKTGTIELSLESVKEFPALFGEIDVNRTLQSLPGVSTVGEGTSGVNVRGGDVHENLVLLDNVPIYNGSHVFGFFSAINSDLLDSFELIKGGMSPNFGGRVSSVINMKLKDGNQTKWQSLASASNLIAKGLIHGPIIKDKLSLMLGGRFNYSDYLLKASKDPQLINSSASFNDLLGKVDFKNNNKLSVSVLFYNSEDEFRFLDDTTYSYSTQLGKFSISKTFSDRLKFSISSSLSHFNNRIEGGSGSNSFRYNSGIQSYHQEFSAIFNASNTLYFDFGVQHNRFNIRPDAIEYIGSNALNESIDVADDHSREIAAFANTSWTVSPKLGLSVGFRFSNYTKIGPGKEYSFINDSPKEVRTLSDTLIFNKGAKIIDFPGVEPRISANYRLGVNQSIKASYQRTRQFIHQLYNSVAVSPFAIWKSSNTNIKPTVADQFVLGYYRNFLNNTFETSLEVYYRELRNKVIYEGSAELIVNETIETEVHSGLGRSHGIEFLIKKNRGRLKGWLSYTYSRSKIKSNSLFNEEVVNGGNYFPASSDRPHIFNSSISYQLSKRWSVSSNFSYAQGRPVTYPVARTSVGGVRLVVFSKRNQFRIPDSHRLDISFTLKGNLKKNQKIKTNWSMGVYNVYGRKNPYSVFFGKRNIGDPSFTSYKLSVLARPIPFLSVIIKYNSKQ